MSDRKNILLIDSFAQIFRCYYAVRALSNRNGEPTNAVFGMLRFLLKLEEKYPGAPGAFVFDKGRPPHRMKLAPDYKANRPPTPEDLLAQLPAIRELIGAFGWNLVEEQDCEADDLIASIALQFAPRPVSIVSADKDLSQLVCPRIDMLVPDMNGKGFARRGIDEVREKFGVPPEAVIDYLALIGDTADNIPGVPGVGPKTAAQLLQKFGSVGAMLDRASEIERESLRSKILAAKERLAVNIELVRLVSEPPSGAPWPDETIERRPLDIEKIRAVAEQKELRSMFRDIDALGASASAAPEQPAEEEKPAPAPEPELEQLSLF